MKKKRSKSKRQGLKYYRKKKYEKAIYFLEKALTERKDDPEVYLFLGYASLKTGDVEGARRYFRGGLLIREKDPGLLKGLAYVYLGDERVEDAISLWGEVLEQNPKDRMVKRSLEKLREAEDVGTFIKNMKVDDFLITRLPFLARFKPYLLGIGISAGIVLIGLVFYLTPLYNRALQHFYPEIVKLKQINLPEETPITRESATDALYSFSEDEVKASFVRIKRYIYRGKMNTAMIALNKIMLSNASPAVKERFALLYTFINPPDPLSIDYNPRLFEIVKEPQAYRGVYVVWKGKIANLQKREKGITFDLLVSYEDEDTIEGMVHVSIDGVFYVENMQSVEVFGSFEGYSQKDGKLIIRGIYLKDLRFRP